MTYSLKQLLNIIDNSKELYIQTHDFPDHDAIASALGLQYLLKNFDINSKILYKGAIQRKSLLILINTLEIDVLNSSQVELKESDQIIIVDGCKGSKNVTDLPGEEIGVIDHHKVQSPEEVSFVDIRSEYGACSSIIFHYLKDNDIEIRQDIATALMIGINMDTSLLRRNVSNHDLEAYYFIYSIADIEFVNYIMRNHISVKDLDFYKHMIDEIKINGKIGYCYFSNGCKENLMGIIADFILSLQEIEFVMICADNKENIKFSLRSENLKWDCSKIVKQVLKDIGFGGGHAEMAGGVIIDKRLFNEKQVFNDLVNIINNDL